MRDNVSYNSTNYEPEQVYMCETLCLCVCVCVCVCVEREREYPGQTSEFGKQMYQTFKPRGR